jgi:hypothetical protein
LKRNNSYKTCGTCGKTWDDPLDVIHDRSLRLNGYQAVLPDSSAGVLFLTHEVQGCHSTLAVPVRDYRYLYDGPEYDQCLRGQPSCGKHCLMREDLSPCDAPCSMHWARALLECFLAHEVPAHVR